MGTMTFQADKLPPLQVRWRNGHVQAVSWQLRRSGTERTGIFATRTERPALESLWNDLEHYFAGDTMDFDWALAWDQGTEFERAVWQTLCRVPYGNTRSYQWVAEQLGRPRAVRAVGNANGKNPFSLVVPCHRIIKSDGSIGGYTGGQPIKQRLLTLEHQN